jgi:hypothetical protein
MTSTDFAGHLLATMAFDSALSRLSPGESDVSFHCDKFNTRILKNLEDMMGYEAGGRVLRETAAQSSRDLLARFLNEPGLNGTWQGLDLRSRLEAILELYRVMAFGAIRVVDVRQSGATFASATSYLAEAWIENRSRWHLDAREGPACHDICGHLAAAVSLTIDVPLARVKVTETTCRAFRDARECEFVAAVL